MNVLCNNLGENTKVIQSSTVGDQIVSEVFSSGKLPGLISYQQLLSLSFNH